MGFLRRRYWVGKDRLTEVAFSDDDYYYYHCRGSDKVLSTAYHLEQAFKPIYAINRGTLVGTAIGRYPEDIYDGINKSNGNPWVLCTVHDVFITHHDAQLGEQYSIS